MDLTADQKQILEALKASGLSKKFYWTGGTLLSHYYLYHRQSFDLDFFSDTAFSRDELIPFTDELKRRFVLENIPEKKVFDRWEFFITHGDSTSRCEFVHYNGEKKRIAPLVDYHGILIDSLPDMAANKTMAYIDRNEVKDLFDIYTLLHQKKFTAFELLALVNQKFGATFSEFMFWGESAKSLKNLEGLRLYLIETDASKQDEILKEVNYFFLDQGKDFLTKHLD